MENKTVVQEETAVLFTGGFLFFILFVLLFSFCCCGNYLLAFLLAFFPVGILRGLAENDLRRSFGNTAAFFVTLFLDVISRAISNRIFDTVLQDGESSMAFTAIRKISTVMVIPGKVSLLQALILIMGVIGGSVLCQKISELLPEKIKFSTEYHRCVLFCIRMLKMLCCAIVANVVIYKLLVKLSYPPGYSFLLYLLPPCFLVNTWKKACKDIDLKNSGGSTGMLRPIDVPDTGLDDVAGMEDVKEQIRLRMILPVKDHKKAEQHGIAPGGGILLYGPPGTGKTFIARAVAGELHIPFYAITVADIFGKYVGESENNIRAIFKEIRQNKLSVLFIDELESIFRKRTDEVHETTRKVVSILLQELDGILTHKNRLLLIGATNTPQLVDEAFLRTGRLDVQIFVGLPDVAARKKILEHCFKDVVYPIQEGVLDAVAEFTADYSGADLKGLAVKVKQTAFACNLKYYSVELFEECLRKTSPSPNANIIREIKMWEQQQFH